jgi:glucosamine--fructose-6-phosphate aminotransferase (isomerizing)
VVIYVPKTHKLLQPLMHNVVCQLLSYHVARDRDCNVDRPRNLAKSVTVE